MGLRRWLTSLCCGLSVSAAGATGPDVIVGDIPDVTTFQAGMCWSIGTTSCNLGDQPLAWVSNTNQHPVISQNLYRLSNGRFEQLGQAWLKHGFCALQGTVCGACTPGGSCPALYPGCSDPYSSSLNGQQSGLGPKSEVNAATGFFPYPWINNGTGSGTLFKRLQVQSSADVNVAGALYFVSSMYVQPQDAANGNDLNNQSYRRVTFSSGNMQLAGTTYRSSPGIFAWRDHGLGVGQADPSVNLSPIDVPNDGRFWVGSKAIDLGGGQWRYEYAIQNLNSDRSAQAVSIPLPTTAVLTNLYFRDVVYHSGEPYSNTDWTANWSAGASSVSWATQTFAQNANANALRWDTIYTYSFECNTPPAGGLLTLALFKPGTPTTASALAYVPSPSGQQEPINDDCVNATYVSNGTFPFSNLGASTDGPDETTACAFFNDTQVGNDVWYLYQSNCTGNVTVTTCGSSFDTKIAVYAGATCPAAASAIACNDDSAACGANSLQSSVIFAATSGGYFLIRVGGYNGATGSGTITITDSCQPQPPANNDCGSAIWLAAGQTVDGTTALATNDGSATCGNSASSPDVWYLYRPATSGSVTIDTCPLVGYDTVLSIHTGTCGSLTQIACNDDSCGLQSSITSNLTAGTAYRIRVAGYNGATGPFRIRVTGGGGVIPPANDDCANRSGIALGTTEFSTAGAYTDGVSHPSCNGQVSNDIWYNFPCPETGTLVITTCDDVDFDTRIAVYDGAGCTNYDARLLACNDDNPGCGTASQVSIPVEQGRNYTIRVGANGNFRGSGGLTLSIHPPDCPGDINGDHLVDISDLAGLLANYGTPSGATFEDGDLDGDGNVDLTDLSSLLARFGTSC